MAPGIELMTSRSPSKESTFSSIPFDYGNSKLIEFEHLFLALAFNMSNLNQIGMAIVEIDLAE